MLRSLAMLISLSLFGCLSDDGSSCPAFAEVDADELLVRCTAECRRAIGCARTYNDPDTNEWVCELEPGCQTGVTPQEAFQEMFECQGTCEELSPASRHSPACAATADAVVACFEALSCDAFEGVHPTTTLDRDCAAELDCFSAADCFD